MANEDIMVSIGAQIDDLIAGFNAAAEGVTNSLGEIQTSVASTSEAMQSQLVPAVENANQHLQEIHETTQGVGGALEEIKEKFSKAFEATGAAVAYEAVMKVGEAVEQLGERATQMQSLSKVLNVTVEQFQAMQLAAMAGGTSVEVFARATERLDATLTQARDGSGQAVEKLKQLGITTEQINDPMFQTNDLLMTLHERLENTGTSQSMMNELIKEFGPRAALAANAIKEYDGSQEGVKRSIDEVNGLNEHQVTTLHAMAEWWEHLGVTVKNTASAALVSAHDMKEALDKANESRSLGTGDQGSQYQEIAQQQSEAVAEAANFQADAQIAAMQTVGPVAVEIEDVVTKDTLDNIKQRIAASKAGSSERIAADREYYEAAKEFYGGGNVKEVKDAYNQMLGSQRAYAETVKKQEEELYTFTDNFYKQTTDALTKSLKDQEKEQQDAFKEGVALATQSAKGQMDAVVQGVTAQEAAVKDAYKQGQISNQQELQQTIALTQQKLQAQLQYYETLKYLADGNTKEIERLNQEEVKANQAAGMSIVQAQSTYAGQFRQTWSGVFNTVASTFASNMTKMIQGGETWQKFMQNIAGSILTAILNMFTKWVAQQAISMIETKLLGKEAASSQVSANAASAATGAMASVAAIPYYGWAMAPEVGASTFALAEGYQASIASAAGGYELPSDQLVYAHKDEMVLPAKLSNGIRDMIDAGHSSASGGGVTANINAVDSKSFEGYLKNSRNRDTLAKVMRKARDSGHPSFK